MSFAVSRSDTGQFVLQDPRTDTVVIDDDLLAGLEKLEAAVAEQPAEKAGSDVTTVSRGAEEGREGSGSAFGFRGGSRYSMVLLAAVLPFVWLALLYFALANLLSEQALGRGEQRALEDRVDALETEISALRAEAAAAPRMNKSKPRRRGESKAKTPEPAPDAKLDSAAVAPKEAAAPKKAAAAKEEAPAAVQ